jgi:hypothetical protein
LLKISFDFYPKICYYNNVRKIKKQLKGGIKMDSKLLTLRCNILHQMDEYILLWCDDDIINYWVSYLPDECSTEKLKKIAEDDNLFYECAESFANCCLDIAIS